MSHPHPPAAPSVDRHSPPPPAHPAPAADQKTRPVVPIGTLAVVGFLFLNIVFMWMLALGVQQGRA